MGAGELEVAITAVGGSAGNGGPSHEVGGGLHEVADLGLAVALEKKVVAGLDCRRKEFRKNRGCDGELSLGGKVRTGERRCRWPGRSRPYRGSASVWNAKSFIPASRPARGRGGSRWSCQPADRQYPTRRERSQRGNCSSGRRRAFGRQWLRSTKARRWNRTRPMRDLWAGWAGYWLRG